MPIVRKFREVVAHTFVVLALSGALIDLAAAEAAAQVFAEYLSLPSPAPQTPERCEVDETGGQSRQTPRGIQSARISHPPVRGIWADPDRDLPFGSYVLTPQVRGPAGNPEVVYYVAVNSSTGTADWHVSPDSLDAFRNLDTAHLQGLARSFERLNPWELETARAISQFFSGDLECSGDSFLRSWRDALTDPGWVLGALASTLGGIVAAEVPSAQSARLRTRFSRAASIADRNGLTRAGRALQKHTHRASSGAFTRSGDSASALNSAGQEIVDQIVSAPEARIVGRTIREHGQPLQVIDVIAPDGRGVRFVARDGTLRGFLEPSKRSPR